MIADSTPGMAAWPADLERIYRSDRVALLRTAFLICGSRETAEDVVQGAVARVAGRWSDVENGPGYLYTAVVNGARDQVRAVRHRGPEIPVNEFVLVADPVDATSVDLARALGKLPKDQRTVVVLRYFLDWSDQQIAATLDVRPATVRSWLHRGRNRLRRELEVSDG